MHRLPVYFLDEATASIDPFTETQFQEAPEQILKRHTRIMIAHRLSTVHSASRIIVMAHGEIIEHSSHAQPLSNGGHYAELYQSYLRHKSPDYTVPEGAYKRLTDNSNKFTDRLFAKREQPPTGNHEFNTW